uniref:developmentally-regulated GTP-binding protein 2-like isoform X8 n=1 Tax=Callithrix jacchus TaxID=9483 RepID=UPI0023DD4947|nr:developmentally-regulated GTP-binding protein 2-like isoform X8 [Callithrix jacchus]
MPPDGPPGPSICLLVSSLGPERLQLWHEAELGLPAGDALGVLGPDLHLHQEEDRPDFTDAIIHWKGASVEHMCPCIHRSLASEFKYALVWVTPLPPFLTQGTSTKYSPQQVGLTHTMEHEVIQIVKK